MNILTPWLRSYLPALDISDAQLAAIDRLTRSITNKLLHPQIAALRGLARSNDTEE